MASPTIGLAAPKRLVSVDVRIVAATNQNLEELVETGRFRRDLFHHLNQVTIKVPPLRERPADVEVLAEYFLAKENTGLVLTPDAKSALTGYAWPGNIRELRNMMMTSALFADGERIHAKGFADSSNEACCPNLQGRSIHTHDHRAADDS